MLYEYDENGRGRREKMVQVKESIRSAQHVYTFSPTRIDVTGITYRRVWHNDYMLWSHFTNVFIKFGKSGKDLVMFWDGVKM